VNEPDAERFKVVVEPQKDDQNPQVTWRVYHVEFAWNNAFRNYIWIVNN
jgi:hypothetical protein